MSSALSDLRDYTMKGGNKSRVEVNQRLLIDKMLARYCSQFVVFRECLQNADDAGATECTLDFQMDEGSSNIVQEIVITNNGRVFGEKDWTRLTRIAEGNPDENTVGMFGVGFYSVFSLCEEPIVVSGSDCLVFAWDDCQLVTYSKKLPANKRGTTTSVNMKMREKLGLVNSASAQKKRKQPTKSSTSKLENDSNTKGSNIGSHNKGNTPTINVDSLKAFLAKVLCFTKGVFTISLNINGKQSFQIKKTHSAVVLDEKKYFSKREEDKIFELIALKQNIQHMVVKDASTENAVTTQSLTLNHFEAVFATHLNEEYHQKVQRVTKKPLPSRATVQFLYPSFTQQEQKGSDYKKDSIEDYGPYLQGIVPFSDSPCGQIFVGLATHQTTGTGWHVHASLIPTIERENIDFQDAYLKIWNSDLLFSAGEVGRSIYDIEMNFVRENKPSPAVVETAFSLKPRSKNSKNNNNDDSYSTDNIRSSSSSSSSSKKAVDPQKLVRSNSFLVSHPSKEVGDLLSRGFFNSQRTLYVPCSDTGLMCVLASEDCYLPFEGIEAFAAYPVIPCELAVQCPRFFAELLARQRISQLSLKQVQQSVKENVLTDQQFAAFLSWLCRAQKQMSKAERTKLVNEIKFWTNNEINYLSNIKYFQPFTSGVTDASVSLSSLSSSSSFSCAPSSITTRNMEATTKFESILPLPSSVLPKVFALGLSTNQLSDQLGLKPLGFSAWLEFILTAESKLESVAHVPTILSYISRHSGEISAKEWKQLTNVLSRCACIPSTHGMKTPREVYFPSKALPSDLPQVSDLVIREEEDVEAEEDDISKTEDVAVTHSFLKRLGVRYSSVNVLVDSQQNFSKDQGKNSNKNLGSSTTSGLSIQKLVQQIMSQRKEMSELDFKEVSNKKFLVGCCFSDLKGSNSGNENINESHNNSKSGKRNSRGNNDAYEEKRYAPVELHFQEVAACLEDSAMLVINWPGLKIESEEGQFLVKLGVREAPTLDHMLRLCALSDELVDGNDKESSNNIHNQSRRMRAFEFFVSHFKRHYADYKPAKISAKFIPAILHTVNFAATSASSSSSLSMPSLKSETVVDLTEEDEMKKIHHSSYSALSSSSQSSSSSSVAVIMCSLTECFLLSNPLFPVVTTEAQQLCEKHNVDLGVKAVPSLERSLSELELNPVDEQSARGVFEYLYENAEGFRADLVSKFARMSFIPCKDRLCKPGEVFLRSNEIKEVEEDNSKRDQQEEVEVSANGKRRRVTRVTAKATAATATAKRRKKGGSGIEVGEANLDGFLDYVDYGPRGNSFLSLCGVNVEPSPTQFAVLVMERCEQFFASTDRLIRVERYKAVLLRLASVIGKVDKATKVQLREAKWALAFRKITPEEVGDAADESGEAEDKDECGLVLPSACYLVDNARFEYLLKPWCVPDELKDLYLACGSLWLSAAVNKVKKPVGPATETARSRLLQSLIVSRLPLLCHTHRAEARKGLDKKMEVVLSKLTVREVSSLAMSLTFEKQTYSIKDENCSSCVLEIKGNRATLFVKKSDSTVWYDVAEELNLALFPEGNEYTHLFTVVLSSTLEVLKNQGLPVDRLLKQEAKTEVKFFEQHDFPEGGDRGGGEVKQGQEGTRISLGNAPTKDFAQTVKETAKDVMSAVRQGKAFLRGSFREQEHTQERTDHQCEAIPNQNLIRQGQTFNKLPLFFDDKTSVMLRTKCLQAATSFSTLLLDLAEVLSAKKTSFHMFADHDGSRIAFNKDGSLFFNIRYYVQCHVSDRPSPEDPNYFWYMVACHELAHNGESGHNARHEHLMEGIAVARFGHFMRKLCMSVESSTSAPFLSSSSSTSTSLPLACSSSSSSRASQRSSSTSIGSALRQNSLPIVVVDED